MTFRASRCSGVACVVILTLACIVPIASADRQALVHEVKAAYVFNFVEAAEWPSDAFSSPSSSFRVCVAEPNPFGSLLDRTFQNEQVNGHPVIVSVIKSVNAVRTCHVLFIPETGDSTGALQQAAAGAPVLTIGEGTQFARRGGIITLVPDAGRIRFDVNQQAAASAGVKLSSKVLQVARRIL